MRDFLSVDGTLFSALTKAGELILLSILWLLTSLPLITIGTSTAALYYAIAKSIRRGRGYPLREYLRAWRKNLPKGTLLSILYLLLAALLLYQREYAGEVLALTPREATAGGGLTLYLIYDGMLLVAAAVGLYLFPVISRFEMPLPRQLSLSFVIAVRYIHYTLLLLGALALLVWLQMRFLPLLCILFLPGLYLWGASWLIERAMSRYYPSEAPEGTDAWWLEK